MDPELQVFLRRPACNLQLQHVASIDDTINCVASTCAEGKTLVAVGQADSAVIVLLSENLEVLSELPGHAGGTNSLAFSSNKLVSAGEDGTAAIWDAISGEQLVRLECEGENVDRSSKGHTVTHVACNPSGSMAACAAGRTLHAFELAPADLESTRRVFPAVSGGVIEDVKFIGSDRVLCCYYGGVILHSTRRGGFGVQLEYGTNILSAAATPDLSYIVGGCMDSCVHIWHFQSSPEAAAATRMQATVNADQNVVDETAPPSEQDLVEYSCGGYASKVTHIVFNSAATMLATTGGTQCTVWDFKGPQGPAESTPVVCLGHTKTLTCQAWQPVPDSPILVTGGKDGRVLVYDVTEYAEPPEDDMAIPNFAAPAAVAPDPDLRDEVTALVWNTANPALLYVAHASGELRCWRLQMDDGAANGKDSNGEDQHDGA